MESIKATIRRLGSLPLSIFHTPHSVLSFVVAMILLVGVGITTSIHGSLTNNRGSGNSYISPHQSKTTSRGTSIEDKVGVNASSSAKSSGQDGATNISVSPAATNSNPTPHTSASGQPSGMNTGSTSKSESSTTDDGSNGGSSPSQTTRNGGTSSKPATSALFTNESDGYTPILNATANGTMAGWVISWFAEHQVCSQIYGGVSGSTCEGSTIINSTASTISINLDQLFPNVISGLESSGNGQWILISAADSSNPSQSFPYNYELTAENCDLNLPNGPATCDF